MELEIKVNIKKPIFILVLIFGILNQLYAQYITDVIIEGNINIKEKEIRSQIKTRKKSIYNEENLKEDKDNIFKLGYFEDVTVVVDTETYKVKFIVKEKPYVKKIEFKGNKKIKDRTLKSELSTKEKEYLNRLSLEEDKNKLEEFYKNKGYIFVDIKYDIILDEITNQAKIIFFIIEGQKVTIGRVKIEGTKAYKEKRILKLMKTKQKKVYNEKTLNDDIEEIKKFYKNNGFESVSISTPLLTYNELGNLMYINIKIEEGEKYKIRSIEFYGNTIFSDPVLYKVLVLKEGMVYNEEKLNESKQAIGELYSDKGYIRCVIEPELIHSTETNKMDIKFNIIENGIVYVDRIYIEGLYYTKENVIRREIIIKENDPLRASQVRRSLERIYNLGFLDDVNVDIQPTGTTNYADIVFSITEGKPGMVSMGAGYSSVDGWVGQMQVSHLNLFGRAQRLSLLWEFGGRRQNYEINWTDPWFLNKQMSFGVSIYDLIRQRALGVNPDAYKEHRQGTDLRVGPRLSEYLSLLFTFSFEKVRIYEVQDPSLKEQTTLRSTLVSQIIYDTRDNIFNPTRGNRNSISVQLTGGPLGGDVHYYQPILKTSWFFPTFLKLTFSANANIAFIEPLSGYGYQLTSYDKFHIGGPDTVRGYSYQELGPTDGGTIMFVGNIELKLPIATEKKQTILQGAIFYDVGSTWSSIDDVNLNIGATDDWKYNHKWDNLMKSGVGFGFRFTIPAFPVRFDFGWALQPTISSKQPEFYFTIGQIF